MAEEAEHKNAVVAAKDRESNGHPYGLALLVSLGAFIQPFKREGIGAIGHAAFMETFLLLVVPGLSLNAVIILAI